MKFLVLYQSRNGHTQDVAVIIADMLREQHHTVNLKSVIEVQSADVEAADMLFIGTWVQGFILFGVKPAGADLWVSALPSLAGKPVASFCTYAFNPRHSLDKLGELLTAKGATITNKQAFHRNYSREDIGLFVQRVLASRPQFA